MSIYISGVYTGSGLGKSGMATILYLIYGGFLTGTFILGFIVASIPSDSQESDDARKSNMPEVNAANDSSKSSPKDLTPSINSLAHLKRNVSYLLGLGFLLSAAGMAIIYLMSVRSRDKKLTGIVSRINDTVFILERDRKGRMTKILDYKSVKDKDIDDLEIDILNEFTPRV